jgi:Fe-S cluster assembly protein SufD
VTGLDAALAGAESRLEPLLCGSFHERPQAFTALSAALADDAALVQIPADTRLERPLHVVFVAESSAPPRMSHPRLIVLAGQGSRATIVESHVGAAEGTHLTNAVTHVVLEEGAALELYQLQDEAASAIHVGLVQVRAGRGSRFTSHSLALGASSARHEVLVRLEAEGAEVCLNGLFFADGDRRLDNLTTIEHVAPHCTSRELYKGIATGRGRGAFDGRIIVHPGAFKTDASQSNRNLLLSEAAQVATHPRFEIFADDVKCAHGAAVGQLDESAVFYLRSRGVPLRTARDLLTYAFVSEMVGLLRVEALRDRVARTLASRLGGLEVTAWS